MSNPGRRASRSAFHACRAQHPRTDRSAAAFRLAGLVALVLAGCTGDRPTSGGADVGGARPSTPSTSERASTAAETANACSGTGAHDRHAAAGIGCAVCHACAGALGFAVVTFPGGAGTANGTITYAGGATTCTVACHSPLGAEPQTVAWNAGPLQCTSCHTNVTTLDAGSVRSSHLLSGASTSATCQSCHDQSRHMSGQVRLLSGDGTATSGSCIGCHSGQGQTLGGWTPPLLVGWSDTVAGDFHGERTGTCRFDVLDAAGQRAIGRGALPCPAGQPQAPNALRITSRWWYVSGTSGPWAWTCDIETVDASGARIAPTLTRQACPEGTNLNYWCNSPSDPDCYPTTLVTRGFGGSLLAPYDRGQGALPCAACHDFHASTNAFLLAGKVNGVTIPAGTIDRAGVGGQALCNACHEGDRHQVCRSCHKEVWTTDGEYWWFEG
ncbi:MAG TPA: cytochrome c3 family protein, partial [Longimicrobiales bacterium]